MKPISVGAESEIYRKNGTIIKKRIRKAYRIKEIDMPLRETRTKREFNLIKRAYSLGLQVPKPIKVAKTTLVVEDLENKTLKDDFDLSYVKQVARLAAEMHNHGIIHGDLTTANVMIKEGKAYIIDFGLGYFSNKAENKAVDIFLFKNALKAKHTEVYEKAYRIFLNTYRKYSTDPTKIFEKLREIEARRRYIGQTA